MMVVSAAGSTTNQLIKWLQLSQSDKISAHQVQQELRRYQSGLIGGLLPEADAAELTSKLIADLERLAALLDGTMSDATYAEVVGHGEVWSARLMSAVLNQKVWLRYGLTPETSCAQSDPPSLRLMKAALTRFYSSFWHSTPASGWWRPDLFPATKLEKRFCLGATAVTTRQPKLARWPVWIK